MALVTSPLDSSVTVINVPEGKVLGKIVVGPQPHAVACFMDSRGAYKGAISTVGDDSLVVVDVASLAVEARITGVAGSRALHGIEGGRVAGTNADALTIVDLSTYRVRTRVPVRQPTSVRFWCVASAAENSIVCYDAFFSVIERVSVPTPQEFLLITSVYDGTNSKTGVLLASGGTDGSLFYRFKSSEGFKTLPGVSGVAGMAGLKLPYDMPVPPFLVAATSPSSNRIFLIQKAAPPPAFPANFTAVNGASFREPPIAPNSLASVFVQTGVTRNLVADTVPLPKTLAGVTLRVGGSLTYSESTGWNLTGAAEAPLWFVGPSQINFQIPPGISPGDTVPAQLQRPNLVTLLTTLRIAPTAPGIFSILMNGQGQGAVLNQDNTQNGDPLRILGARPAAAGSVIQIFATGAGETNPLLGAGEPAPLGGPLVLTQAQPTVTIGGRNARVLFSGMAPGWVGLWQINAEVPQSVTPGSAVPMVITAGGVSSNTVTIAVE